MKIEKEHKLSTLMNKSKKELADIIIVLEHNNNVLYETINQQAINIQKMISELQPYKVGD